MLEDKLVCSRQIGYLLDHIKPCKRGYVLMFQYGRFKGMMKEILFATNSRNNTIMAYILL